MFIKYKRGNKQFKLHKIGNSMYNNIIIYIRYKGSGSLLCLCKRFDKKKDNTYINNMILQNNNNNNPKVIPIYNNYNIPTIKLKYIFP